MEILRPDGVSLDDPYVPESVLKALVVGQRVRYVPRGECSATPRLGSAAKDLGATVHEALTNAEGQTGTIIHTHCSYAAGHPYFIEMDHNYEFGGKNWNTLSAAASELVLIEDE